MVDLILTVCMITNPSSCHEERLTYQAGNGLSQCMMLSMPYVAAWAGDHPKWKVKTWKCAWPDARNPAI
ncbi:hypothetical protein [Aurantimonas sp. VKM B-3413]|uniref:hypothetical protein n=1 Tax=Aurantimonas sp. VKM B-3413 TaxID=2779401 RepID=UPI001E463E6C|nr:hypothetical protein [Aurantimonas sp. VKM B-3413]MCB8838217.1 hypothetical protein [Aurantimonas sp. VKM B-3413]